MKNGVPKFLIVRRDNIGDLVCTTPLFSALRKRLPQAEICALVNSYNAAVLENNPDVDAVYAYTKAKHRPKGKSLVRIYWDRIGLFLKLRRKHFDYAILVAPPSALPRTLNLARVVQPAHIIGYAEPGGETPSALDLPVPYSPSPDSHEVEDVFRLLSPLGIDGAPPPVTVRPDPTMVEQAGQTLVRPAVGQLIGIHISARKPSQRWPAARFVELVKELAQREPAAFALFWSPGDECNPLHPGDDRKAGEIISALAGLPVTAYPTRGLQELIAGLSLCDALICSDGGAMHLAAGLGKPILCFFGKSGSAHWHPWGVPHVLLQPTSQEVSDISVQDALDAYMELRRKTGQTNA